MGFIGFADQYEKYKQEQDTLTTTGTGNRISYENIPNISEENLLILKQNHPRHDPYTVFMQADETFYESFYDTSDNQTSGSVGDPYINAELLADVKSIRKVHSRFDKYARDMILREKYMDALAEKYGGQEKFEWLLSIGGVRDYIPNLPLFSTTSDEYELYLQGGPTVEIGNDLSDEEVRNLIMSIAKSRELDFDDIEVVSDVVSNFIQRSHSEIEEDTKKGIRTTYNNSIGEVSYSNMQELRQMFKSWYIDDTEEKDKKSSDDKSNYFCDTPNAVRKKYFTSKIEGTEGILTDIINGTYVEPDDNLDPNEMVVDPSTGKAMTRAELDKRKLLRTLTDCGFDELKLMRHFGVGSKYEINLKKEELRRRRRGKKKAKSLVGDIVGDNFMSEASTIEDLEKYLFND